jgi:hypothetical protein
MSTRSFLAASAALLALLLPALASAQQYPLAKKVIEYGWDVPTPEYVRDHIRDMEKRPFDGLMMRRSGTRMPSRRTSTPSPPPSGRSSPTTS